MPTVKVNGASIYYEDSGSGPETVVFSHGLLLSGEMYRDQITDLQNQFRCIAYDHRGQGRSEVTANGYDIESITRDVAELIVHLDCSPCHFVGLSMGGFVGIRLALRRPELLRSLVLMGTSADPEKFANKMRFRMLAVIARLFGFGPVINPVMELMFGQGFLENPLSSDIRETWKRFMLANDRIGSTRAALGVIGRSGVYEQLDEIQLPTLIMSGEEDAAIPVEKSRRLNKAIRNSELVIAPNAGHLLNIEQAPLVNSALRAFLNRKVCDIPMVSKT